MNIVDTKNSTRFQEDKKNPLNPTHKSLTNKIKLHRF